MGSSLNSFLITGQLLIADDFFLINKCINRKQISFNCLFRKIVLATDDSLRNIVDRNLTDLGITDRLDGVYTYQDMVEIAGYDGKRKDLKRVCKDFGITPAKAVFISDGTKDSVDADRDGVNFIHVPYYEQGDEPFSFAMIDFSKQLPKYLDLREVNPSDS